MSRFITASMLYNLIQCPHRLNLDLHEDPAKRDVESKFVEFLWERGTLFEAEVMSKLRVPFVDYSSFPDEERERRTREAMDRKAKLIYGGRITFGDLLGEPDILRFDETKGYIAGDIKSGSGDEGDDDTGDGKPKKHYAVQLALYTDILESRGVTAARAPFIWDVHGREVIYDLDASQGTRAGQTLWELYKEKLGQAHSIASRPGTTLPALGSACKLCHWRTHCIRDVENRDDLTLIPELGRSKRDMMMTHVPTVRDLVKYDPSRLMQGGKSVIKGLSLPSLEKFRARARLLCDPDAVPYCTATPDLPHAGVELFFDIEVDPMRDVCYLHGFVERRNRDNATERFVPFMAESPTPEEEESAFAGAWEYVQSCRPCAIYFYSKYERTWWRKLQQRYPRVATEEEIEAMFRPGTAVDLYYDVVKKHTEWPTRDHSIKTLAHYLGFKWRDTSPSGADSIEWYHRWIESGDPAIRQRILDYNEDDCVATRVLLDGIRELKIG